MSWLKMCHRTGAVLCMFGLLFCAVNAKGSEASYVAFEVPGALGTFSMSMNNAMTVTGYYTTSPSTASAFMRDAAGTITTFSIRGGQWTEPESINESGDIAGFYVAADNVPHSFLRYADGRVVTFDPPPDRESASQPVAINSFDDIAGNYPLDHSAGFLRFRSGSFISVDYTAMAGAAYPTGILDMNANGAVVGYADGGGDYIDGFLLHFNGEGAGSYMQSLSVPVSWKTEMEETIPEAINDDGVIAGWCRISPAPGVVAQDINGGFVRSPQGDYTLFNPPGTLVLPALHQVWTNTAASIAPRSLSLNASGVIAGTYTDASGTKHGFVRNPYGTITPFDPPRGMQTTATSINDSGVIGGNFYYDWNSQTSIGFLRIPEVQP